MLAEYSQQTSLADAVAKTFDGEHPCGLCKKIAGAQRAPKKNATVTLSLKPDLICSLHTVALRPRSSDISFAAFTADPAARVFSPIVPPPRSELA